MSIYGRPNQLISYKVQQRSSTRNYRERNPIELQCAGVILDPPDFKSSPVQHFSMPPGKKEGFVALKQSCRLRSIHGQSRIFLSDVNTLWPFSLWILRPLLTSHILEMERKSQLRSLFRKEYITSNLIWLSSFKNFLMKYVWNKWISSHFNFT